MHFARFPIFLTLLSYVHITITRGLGINCRGSSQCSKIFQSVGTTDLIIYFNESLWIGGDSNLPNGPIIDKAFYYFGQHIMCAQNGKINIGSICLFLQGNIPDAGIPGWLIKRKIAELAAHGCKMCGSVPLGPLNNPAMLGILTSNYVTDKGCQGLCSPGNTTDPVVQQAPVPTVAAGNQTTATTANPAEAGPTEDPQTRRHPWYTANPGGKRGV